MHISLLGTTARTSWRDRSLCQLGALALMGLQLVTGCTRTETTHAEIPGPPRVAVMPPSGGASRSLTASFRVEGDEVVGDVAPASMCLVKETRTVTLKTTTQKKTDTLKNAIWAGGGAAGVGAGTALILTGKRQEQDGKTTFDTQGQIGIGVAVAGGVALALGGVGLLFGKDREPEVTEKKEQRTSQAAGACGTTEDLAGTELELEVPGAGARFGRVDASGRARIGLKSKLTASQLGPLDAGGTTRTTTETVVRVRTPSRRLRAIVPAGTEIGRIDLAAYLASLDAIRPKPVVPPPSAPEPAAPDFSEYDRQEFSMVVRGGDAVRTAFSLTCTPAGGETCNDAIDNDCNGTYDDSCGYAPGSLQWTLAWSTDDDLDLHVVGPDGVEVWAGHRQGGNAGLVLDRDCRGRFGPPCPGGNIENIYIPRTTKPMQGTYQVWVEVAQAAGGAGAGNAGTRSIAIRLGGRLAGKTYSMPLSLLAQTRTRLYWAFALGQDADRDGVADADDACPNAAGRWSLVAAERGCPDGDGDGVADKADACPAEAGVRASDPARSGCPKLYGKAKLTAFGVEITEAILFATGSAAILPQSHGLLRDIATVMKKEPERLRKVLLEGHTDNTGTPARNVKLSEDRVAAVRDWLMKREGVAAGRMEIAWYGQDKPIDTNDTEAGRSHNRRVVFRVIDPAPSTPPSW